MNFFFFWEWGLFLKKKSNFISNQYFFNEQILFFKTQYTHDNTV